MIVMAADQAFHRIGEFKMLHGCCGSNLNSKTQERICAKYIMKPICIYNINLGIKKIKYKMDIDIS